MADDNRLFQLEIITPDRIFYKGQASMVEFTAQDGDIGIYKDHIPLTTVIAPGILTITETEGKKTAALLSGFVEVLPDKVTVLAEVAEWPDEIDVDRAEAARQRAEEHLKNHEAEIDVIRAEIALKRALVRLDVGK